MTILSSPPATSNSATADFTYSSSESGSTFQCRLDNQAFATCPSGGSTYQGLANGTHTFGVRATDGAGNVSEAAAFSWTVDVAPPPVNPAKLGRVSVTGPKSARKGKRVTFKVKVTNSGGAAATGVRVRASGRGIAASSMAGAIPAGASKTVKLRLRPKKTGTVKVSFKVTSANAGNGKVGRRISVLRR